MSPRAVRLMQVCVNFDYETGHPDADKDAAVVEKLRQGLNESGAQAGGPF